MMTTTVAYVVNLDVGVAFKNKSISAILSLILNHHTTVCHLYTTVR